jgi:hypothetical protein
MNLPRLCGQFEQESPNQQNRWRVPEEQSLTPRCQVPCDELRPWLRLAERSVIEANDRRYSTEAIRSHDRYSMVPLVKCVGREQKRNPKVVGEESEGG